MLLPLNYIEIAVKSDANKGIITLFLSEKVYFAAPKMRPLQNLTHSLSFLFLSTIGSPAVYIFDF